MGDSSQPTSGFTVGCGATNPATFSVGFEAAASVNKINGVPLEHYVQTCGMNNFSCFCKTDYRSDHNSELRWDLYHNNNNNNNNFLANRPRKVQQGRSSTRSDRKHI